MTREPNLDDLTTLLGQCLGRIDERAYRLQQNDDADDLDAPDVLEQEAATLQELVSSLIERNEAPQPCDLNRIVHRAITSCLAELGTPIVVRQHLADNLPLIACQAGQLAFATQRALMIAVGRLDAGGELLVTTRAEEDSVLLEIESRGGLGDHHLQERAETLCDFVASFGGNCRMARDERNNLLVVIELLQVSAFDDR